PAQYTPIDWFPDGNHLLLLSATNSGDLWKMSTWDSSLRKLWAGNATEALVSPDGSHIAFLKDDQLWRMGADGDEPREILAGDGTKLPGGIAWSPNGQRLAYVRFRGTFDKRDVTIETCDLAGGAGTVVLSDPDLLFSDSDPTIAWLPDGRIIYPTRSKSGDFELWAITADPSTGKQGGGATRLAGWKNFQAAFPQASADGKRLIASRKHTENGIYIGNLASKDKTFTPHRFTLDGWRNSVRAWTKDSKAILFESKRNGKAVILKQDIDAKTPETLVAGSENYFYPILSAEGALLYTAADSPDFYSSSDTTVRLMSTPLQGGTRSTLVMGSYYYACGSSPSSSCVLSELKDKQLIFFHLDPVNGKGEEIARLDGYRAGDSTWDLSPDGSRLAIVDQGQSKGNEVRILNLADRKVTVLPVRDWKWQYLQHISWAADGKGLFALAGSGSSFALLSIDANGNPKVLQEIPAGAGWIASIVPSPDGRSLAFTKRTSV